MEKKIITISREFGSGGRTIGRMVAERLGIPFYDKELVDQIAVESGFAPKFVEEHGEHSPGKSLFSYAFAPQGVPGVMNGLSTADFLWNIQCSVTLQLAEQGPCVIVGRNADYILKDRQDALHVYVFADVPYRAERIVRRYGESALLGKKDFLGIFHENDAVAKGYLVVAVKILNYTCVRPYLFKKFVESSCENFGLGQLTFFQLLPVFDVYF